MELLRSRKPGIIDPLTVAEKMDGDAGENLLALSEMVESCPTSEHSGYYAEQVRTAERRRTLHTAARLAVEALARGDALDDVAADLLAAGEAVEGGEDQPQIVSAADFAAVDRAEPAQIVRGVLRAGQIGILSATSKAGKSWSLMAAAFAVATGGRWFGWNAAQGRVLYVNAELPDYDLESRLKVLCDALGLAGLPAGLDVWHLRGRTMSIPQLLPAILRRQREQGPYALILPDPLYRFGQGRAENDNAVQALTMAELNELAERTSAAYSPPPLQQGQQGRGDHLDGLGGGMFARAPTC
jgi:RecA-family ATPase